MGFLGGIKSQVDLWGETNTGKTGQCPENSDREDSSGVGRRVIGNQGLQGTGQTLEAMA